MRSSSSARICAWIVTSSAVVGSSAIRTFGSQRERDRDHHALAQTSRELMGIVLADAPSAAAARRARAPRARGPRLLAWTPRDAGGPARRPARRSSWSGSATTGESWKIIATVVAADPAQLASRSCRRARCSSALIEPPTMWPPLGSRPRIESAEHRLAAAGLADQPDRLAALDPEVDVADGVDDRPRELDLGREVVDLERGGHRCRAVALSGAGAVRRARRAARRRSGCRPARPRPGRRRPGRRATSSPEATYCWALPSMSPQEAVGYWRPKPRKPRYASARIASATWKVMLTITTDSAFGIRCRNTSRRCVRAHHAPRHGRSRAPAASAPRRAPGAPVSATRTAPRTRLSVDDGRVVLGREHEHDEQERDRQQDVDEAHHARRRRARRPGPRSRPQRVPITVAISAARKPISSAVWPPDHDPAELVEAVLVGAERMCRARRQVGDQRVGDGLVGVVDRAARRSRTARRRRGPPTPTTASRLSRNSRSASRQPLAMNLNLAALRARS